MCGIAGIFSTANEKAEDIRKITDTLRFRGPDAEGYFVDQHVALGHKRLSIIDLDSRSNQPFTSGCGRFTVVFNGEIYNYRALAQELVNAGVPLRTTSDTEVIVEGFSLWGTGFVHKLNGMFAFAIYDKFTRQLFLYRDRNGKKPLFYFLQPELFVFGSELKTLLAHPQVKRSLTVKKASISSFLQLGYIPKPNTFFENIFKFPEGHYAILNSNFELSVLPYWNIAHHLKTSRSLQQTDAFNQLKGLVTNAVAHRLVADVPVGIFLSGGIDSSLVASVAAQRGSIKTFSIGFKESKFDESAFAEKIARHLKTDHATYILQERDAVELVDQYLEYFDEPFADTSAIPTMLISKLARQEVKVALTGDGGDELFLGYGAHTWAKRLSNPVIQALRPALHTLLKNSPSPRLKRVSHLFEKIRVGKHRRHIFSQEQYFFSEHEVTGSLLADKTYYEDWPYDDFRYIKILSEAERQALFDLQFYLRDDLLVKVDRASMFYGLECRCPLLDTELIEFVINLPERFKKQGNISKYLLRRMLYELVPEKYFARPKWGFSIPLAQWLNNDLNYLFNYLSAENLAKTGAFDISYVNSLKTRFANGEHYLYNRLWTLIISQKFLLRYGSN